MQASVGYFQIKMMKPVEIFVWLCFWQVVECVPVDIADFGVPENTPEPLPLPIVRRSADWDSYWAAHYARGSYIPHHGYYANSHIPATNEHTDILKFPHGALNKEALNKEETAKPLYVWRFTPVRKHPKNSGQPLNNWLGEKITAHASPSEHNSVWEATLLSDGRETSVEHGGYPVKSEDDVIVAAYVDPGTQKVSYEYSSMKDHKDKSLNREVSESKSSKDYHYTGNEDSVDKKQSVSVKPGTISAVSTEKKPSANEAKYDDGEKMPDKPVSKPVNTIYQSTMPPKMSKPGSQKTNVFGPGYRRETPKKSSGANVQSEKYFDSEKNLLAGKSSLDSGNKSSFDHDDDEWEDCDEECDDDIDYDDMDDPFDRSSNDFDQEELKKNFVDSLDSKFRALVFNPMADSKEKFQSCTTPTNETGNCRYIQHCLLSSIIGGIQQFMSYVCLINDRFIGVCCPDYPVEQIKVDWDETATEDSANETITPAECGHSSKTRVVGGSQADPAEYPWMAALLTMDKGQFFCGGSIINDHYILTAAHCTFSIPRNQILVRLGEYDFGNEDPDSPGEDYPVVEIKRHGLYSRRTLQHDIALLKLGRRIEFNQRVSTICFPKKDEDFVGRTAMLAGWGNTKGGGPSSEVLLEAALEVVNNSICAENHGLPVPSTFVCTQSDDDKSGACNGDSGGPLMLMDEASKQWKIIGLVSWGRRGCEPTFPTVYTKITEYLDWINAHAS